MFGHIFIVLSLLVLFIFIAIASRTWLVVVFVSSALFHGSQWCCCTQSEFRPECSHSGRNFHRNAKLRSVIRLVVRTALMTLWCLSILFLYNFLVEIWIYILVEISFWSIFILVKILLPFWSKHFNQNAMFSTGVRFQKTIKIHYSEV
jgi:cobalamin synthase